LQPGHLLISLALTLSVGFSMSITLHAATQAWRFLALTAAGFLSQRESPYGSRQQFIWTHQNTRRDRNCVSHSLHRGQIPEGTLKHEGPL